MNGYVLSVYGGWERGGESPMGYINISDKEYESPVWYKVASGRIFTKSRKKINNER